MAAQTPLQYELFNTTDYMVFDTLLPVDFKDALLPIIEASTTMVRFTAIDPQCVWNKQDSVRGQVNSTTWELYGNQINVNAKRLDTFRSNRKCVCCGIEGNVFLIERHLNDKAESRHLNLYAASRSGLVLLTVDHILPDSMAGRYNPTNFQTMCSACNSKKQNVMSLEEIARVRANMDDHVKSWAYQPYILLLLELQELITVLKDTPKRKQMYNALVKASKQLIQGRSTKKLMQPHCNHLRATIDQLKGLSNQPVKPAKVTKPVVRPVEPRITTYYEDFYHWAVAKWKELRKYRLVIQKIA